MVRWRSFTSAVFALFVASTSAFGAPALTATTAFTPADSARTAMDVGGVWNGTTEVTNTTGDNFRFSLANGSGGATAAFDLALSVDLPVGFNYVAGTATVGVVGAGCGAAPTVSPSVVGNTLQFGLTPAGYDLPPDCRIDLNYGIRAQGSVGSGTYVFTPTWNYSLTDGGALVGASTTSEGVLAQTGGSTLTISPSAQTKAVGDVANFNVSFCNSGLGGLFDIVIDETALNPNPAGSLQITSMTQTAPVAPLATGTLPVLTLKYLAPGSCFTTAVTANVLGCQSIVNAVTTSERTGSWGRNSTGSVTLDLTTPLIAFSAPTTSVPFGGTQTVTFAVNNTGLGDAFNTVLRTNLETLPLSVTNVSAGWTYSSVSGDFTLVAGTIPDGGSVPLSFDVGQTACPPTPHDYTIVWKSSYTNGCGNPYTVPTVLEGMSINGVLPITFKKDGPPGRLNLNESSTWNLKVTAADLSQLGSGPVVVTDMIPTGVTGVSVGSAPAGTVASCGGPCTAGSTITWTIPKAAIVGTLTLPINFTAPADPCTAGGQIVNLANISGTYGLGCGYADSSAHGFYVAQTPGFTSTQSFNAATGASGDTSFETGLADGGDGVRQIAAGEGEFISFSNTADFGVGQPGQWVGSTYKDDFASVAGQTLVANTLTVRLDGAGAPIPVPAGSILSSTGQLLINLDFLAGPLFFNSPNVSGRRVDFAYKTTIPDAAITGVEPFQTIVQRSVLTVSGAASGCVSGGPITFTQPLSFVVYRSAHRLDVSLPQAVDICQDITATFSVPNRQFTGGWNERIVASSSADYEYLTPQTPVYGGAYSSSNITYAENGGVNPSFTYGPTPLQQNSTGTVGVQVRVKAGTSGAPTSFGGTLTYDDTQTNVATGRSFTVNGSAAPAIVRQGDIAVLATPSTLYISGSQVRFRLYVVNGGDGATYNTKLQNILPVAMVPNASATDALNPGFPVAVAGNTMTWSLGSIAAGATRQIEVVGNMTGSVCSAGANSASASWGCGGTDHETVNASLPTFQFPTGAMQVVHDSSQTNVGVCDTGGRVVLIAKNTGAVHIYGVKMKEVLEPVLNGVDISGAAEYSTDGGSTWTAVGSSPTGAGTSGSPYLWTSAQIPALADLAPTTEAGISEVRLRFPVSGNETANAVGPITATADGNVGCGDPVASSPASIVPGLRRPDMVVATQGRNLTTGSTVGPTVYGKPGDVVEWQIAVQNRGTFVSKNVLFTDDLPNSPASPTGTLNGPGQSNTPVTDGVAISLADITAPSTVNYTVTQTLAGTCVNENNTGSVTWGCDGLPPHLSTPSHNADSAALVMSPSFAGTNLTQTFTSLNGGRGELRIDFSNSGAVAQNLVLTDTLPTGWVIDSTFVPTVTGTGLTGVALGGTATVPVFTITGSLDHNDSGAVTYRILPTSGVDTTSSPFVHPETVANGFDPVPPAGGPNNIQLAWTNGCGVAASRTDNTSFTPKNPDVDVNIDVPALVADAGTPYTFNITLVNNGDSGSVADHILFTPAIGSGWVTPTLTVTSPGTGGTGGVCAATCTMAQIGTLAAGQTAVIRFVGTASAAGPLTVHGLVTGTRYKNDGTATPDEYSHDEVQPKVAGFKQTLTFQSTSEAFTTGQNLAVGEEAVLRLRGEWFGIDPGDAASGFTAITMRSTLPTNLGFVSYAATGANNVGITTTATAGDTGAINFAVGDLTPPTTGGIFEVDMVVRARNVGANISGATFNFPLGSRFTLYGSVFASNNAADGFGGTQASLHGQTAFTIQRPTPGFVKQVRNVDLGGSFASTATGQAGNTLEYQITVTNTGTAPLFDLVVTDTLPTTLSLVSGAGDGVDNDGDGVTDDATEGSYVTGPGGVVTFNDANTALTSGQSLARLDGGQTITLKYRATIGGTVTPMSTVVNAAALDSNTLPGPTGSQTAPTAATGTTMGEAQLTATGSASTTIDSVTFGKTLMTTSVGGDTATNVLVGEQARFRISFVLPQGTTPALVVNDSLPQTLQLVNRVAPSLGSAISGCSAPVLTPASLPAQGNPLAVSWNFGTCTVGAGTAAQRTVTIDYDAQVRNTTNVADGTTIANQANYTFTGYTSPNSTVTLTARLPVFPAAVVSVNPTTGADAGDVLTYTVTVRNTGTVPAYDLRLQDTIPVGTTYVAGSTTVTAGPAIPEPDVGPGQALLWGRTQTVPQTINLNAGQTLTYTYQVRLADTVKPNQVLTNAFTFDATSLPGSPGPDNGGAAVGAAGAANGERNGSGTAPNTFNGAGNASSTVSNVTTVLKVRSGDTLSPNGFRVGDLVTYTVTATVPEASLDNFRILDTLPAGLAFDSFDTITPAPAATLNYTVPSGANAPAAGATGALTWIFGNISATGDNVANQTFTLVYRARVVNAGGIGTTPVTQSVNNSARATYLDFAAATQTTAASVAAASLQQPLLTSAIALRAGQPTTVHANEVVKYRLTLSNIGTAPAFNADFAVTLPVGMRLTTPTTTATLNGAPTTLSPPTYNGGIGELRWQLPDAQTIPAGQDLVIDLDATADATLGGSTTLTNSFAAAAYASLAATGAPTDRRVYAALTPVTVDVSTPAPTDFQKLVSLAVGNIGQPVSYTLTAPLTPVSVSLFDVNVTDTVPAGMRVTSVTTNAATLGATLTDNTAGQNVGVIFSRVPAGQQAVVTVNGVIDNVVGNQSGTILTNGASYTWAKTSGGAAQTAIPSGSVTTTVQEPVLAVDATFVSETLADSLVGLQAGDKIRYHVLITNSGTGAGHDLVIRNKVPATFQSPTVIANPGNPGAPTNNGTTAGITDWVWNVAGPIAAGGGTYAFDVEYTLGAVQPFQNLTNTTDVTWTSLAGPSPDERTGAGGVNDYAAVDPTPVTRTTGSVRFSKVESAPAPGVYPVGGTVTYRLTMTFISGRVNAVRFLDTLPAGLRFVSAAVTGTNAQKAGGGALAIATGPTAGDLGALTFTFGDVESTGANPAIHLDVVARVRDIPGNISGAVLTNVASGEIDDPNNPGTPVTIVATTNPQVTVQAPTLVAALDGPTIVALGSPATYHLRAQNTGTSPGFQPVMQVRVPSAMRANDPTTLSAITANVTGGRTVTLASGTDFTTNYVPATGVLSITFTSASSFIATAETLDVQFKLTLDNGTAAGTNLAPDATLTSYASQDQSAGAVPETRVVSTTIGTGSTGTANGAIGDDTFDDAPLTTIAPAILVTKGVSTPTAAPGNTLNYTITFKNTGVAAASITNFVDDMSASFVPGSIANVVVTPSTGTLTVTPNGGANSTGQILITGASVPGSGATMVVTYQVTLRPVLPSGTIVKNQAFVTVAGYTNPFLSDSTNPADDDGIDTGNAPGIDNDDDPTRVTIVSAPILTATKTAVDLNGPPLLAGETIEYTMVLTNTGNEHAVSASLQDGIPSNTDYVPNSTTLNGVAVPDLGGVSALSAGMPVNTVSASPGTLRVGGTATVVFRVNVRPGTQNGVLIANQGFLTSSGEGSGPRPLLPTDNPATSAPSDRTELVVGSGASISARKFAVDINGGSLAAGDAIEYTIVVRNSGSIAATGIDITDAIPTNTAYDPGTLEFDADGPSTGGGYVAQTDAADGDAASFAATGNGQVRVQVPTLAPGAELSFRFHVLVGGAVPAGTIISNQAMVNSNELPPVLTDADSDPSNGAQPTVLVVGSGPALRLLKSVTDLNGGAVLPGDTLVYTLSMQNIGTVDATTVVITDAVPSAPTTYVANSTQKDGIAVADVSGASRLVTGLTIPTLAAGASATIRYAVTIPLGTAAGTRISNQATYTAAGGLTGLSDSDLDDSIETGNNPGDPNDDDPTVVEVGATVGIAAVRGIVWRDKNLNNLFDPGETPEGGWQVEVLRNAVVLRTVTAAADGTWFVNELTPGDGYTIRFRHPVSGAIFGGPVSSEPNVDLENGSIGSLRLPAGITILNQNLPIQPGGVVYDSVTRAPVAGARVELRGPAGFDPATQLLPGQQGQVTGADGSYRFDLAQSGPIGEYHVAVTVPNGYLPAPSTIIAPEPIALVRPAGLAPYAVVTNFDAPKPGESTRYYADMVLDPSRTPQSTVVNNHIPIDPILGGALQVTKTTPLVQIRRGELVPYTVRVRNNLSATLSNIDVTDLMPPGFQYVAGSSRLNNVALEPQRTNRTLVWANQTFSGSEEKVWRLVLIAGAGVGLGDYTNEAYAINSLAATLVSNRSTATVRVIADEMFDCPEVVGRVFDDWNRNGVPDEGEPGIPGVRLATARGWLVTADDFGRFHITCPMIPRETSGSNFVLKIDESTLPTGYRTTTDNPRVIRLTAGKMTKVNFGAAIHRVVRMELRDDAFQPGVATLKPEWESKFASTAKSLDGDRRVVRLAYWASREPRQLVHARIEALRQSLNKSWNNEDRKVPLVVEEEITWASEGNREKP